MPAKRIDTRDSVALPSCAHQPYVSGIPCTCSKCGVYPVEQYRPNQQVKGDQMNAEALELSGALATELARPALDLTLHQIETELAQLIEYRQERLADTVDRPSEDEIAALDAEIQRYQIAEPKKVTGVAAIFRSWRAKRETAKAEANRLLQIVKHYECMEARLKDYAAGILEQLPKPAHGCRKLVGKDGSQLMLKGNGGVQPLEITDAEAVPDELCTYVLRLAGAEWRAVEEVVRRRVIGLTLVPERQVNNEAVREALAQPCPECDGKGIEYDASECDELTGSKEVACPACGGSGKHAIPGARLLDRGVHVECR